MSKCDQFAPFCIRLQLSWLTMALRTTSQCNKMGITFGKWADITRIISYTSRQSLPVEDFVVWKITNTCVGSIGSGTRRVLRCLRLVRITAAVITRRSPWSCRRSGLLSVCIKAYLNVGKLQQTRSCKCHACHQWIGLLIFWVHKCAHTEKYEKMHCTICTIKKVQTSSVEWRTLTPSTGSMLVTQNFPTFETVSANNNKLATLY